MAFTNSPEFEDDFRKVGPNATSGFAPAGSLSDATEHASSENLEVAGAADEDDLEEDEDLDDEDEDDEDEDEDDLEDDDLDDEDEEEDDVVDEEDDDEDEDEDDEELEDEDDAVKARLGAAEKRVRAA